MAEKKAKKKIENKKEDAQNEEPAEIADVVAETPESGVEAQAQVAQTPNQAIEGIYEPGKPTGPYNWRAKLQSRDDMLRYLRTSEYRNQSERYGSERRRTPA